MPQALDILPSYVLIPKVVYLFSHFDVFLFLIIHFFCLKIRKVPPLILVSARESGALQIQCDYTVTRKVTYIRSQFLKVIGLKAAGKYIGHELWIAVGEDRNGVEFPLLVLET